MGGARAKNGGNSSPAHSLQAKSFPPKQEAKPEKWDPEIQFLDSIQFNSFIVSDIEEFTECDGEIIFRVRAQVAELS